MNREERRRQKRWENKREITEITTSGGRVIPAEKAICPECKVLDLKTVFDTDDPIEWTFICSSGHEWKVDAFDFPAAEPTEP